MLPQARQILKLHLAGDEVSTNTLVRQWVAILKSCGSPCNAPHYRSMIFRRTPGSTGREMTYFVVDFTLRKIIHVGTDTRCTALGEIPLAITAKPRVVLSLGVKCDTTARSAECHEARGVVVSCSLLSTGSDVRATDCFDGPPRNIIHLPRPAVPIEPLILEDVRFTVSVHPV